MPQQKRPILKQHIIAGYYCAIDNCGHTIGGIEHNRQLWQLNSLIAGAWYPAISKAKIQAFVTVTSKKTQQV
ncbi:MAG: hypothetical protein WBM24_21130 [Candidatus Sulfotelmatobacter sp.]